MEIVSVAICASIFNDLRSGRNINLCIITKASFALNDTISFFYLLHLDFRLEGWLGKVLVSLLI